LSILRRTKRRKPRPNRSRSDRNITILL